MAKDITVQQRTQRIVVTPSSGSIALDNGGPIGPAGPGLGTHLSDTDPHPVYGKITAQSNTTGQFQVEGVELGDTGWRDIKSECTIPSGLSIDNGLTTTIQARRIGNEIFIALADGMQCSATFGYSTNFWTPAQGFRRVSGAATYDASFGPQNQPVYFRNSFTVVGGVRITAGTAGQFQMEMVSTYATNTGFFYKINTGEDWPASLPGSQATPPLTM